jgi:hypothetical protein
MAPARQHALVAVAGAAAAAFALAGCGGSAATPSSSVAPPATVAPPGTAASSNAAGPFPTPQEETYQGCPPQGDGGDAQLNIRKNRIDMGTWQATSVGSILALTWPPAVAKAPRATWSQADADTVAQNEGRPVIAEGYILMVRHEGPESPNCHDASSRDYHVWLAASASDTRANAVVVELTPRVVARNPGWGSSTNILRLAHHHVRVGGWLLLDQEHPEQLHRTRGTLWEIHPVMQVYVDQNGTWTDLNGGQASLGNAAVNNAPASDGATSSGSSRSGSSRSTHHRHRKRHHHSG